MCRCWTRPLLPDILTFGHSAMMEASVSKVGRRGTVVLPAKLCRRLVIEEGTFVVAEEREDSILRPAAVLPLEIYTSERKAEFLLNNAVDAADYRAARTEVKRLSVDPDRIKHKRPWRRV